MIDPPKIITLKAQTIAKIHQIIPRSQIQQVMGKTLIELKSAIEAQQIKIIGPWFTHHLQPPGENFDFDICFPVSAVIQTAGRSMPGEWPAMTVVQTIYHGGYENLGRAWGEFMQWIKENNHPVTGEIWERYLKGPETGSDSTKWQTELNRELKP